MDSEVDLEERKTRITRLAKKEGEPKVRQGKIEAIPIGNLPQLLTQARQNKCPARWTIMRASDVNESALRFATISGIAITKEQFIFGNAVVTFHGSLPL